MYGPPHERSEWLNFHLSMGELGEHSGAQSWGGLWAIDPTALGNLEGLSQRASRTAPRAALPVAVVDIEGPLAQRAGSSFFAGEWDGYDAIADRFSAAIASDARAVVLRINSPGGAVAGCFEAVRAMREAKAAAGKPVVAYVDEAAFSAAYALATVADAIYLPRSGAVGSVGVIATRADMTAAAEKAGLKVTVIASGGQKGDGHPMTAFGDDERQRMQARVDELAREFAELVGEGRGMALEAVLGLDAGTRSGPAAVRAGLADGVAGLAAVTQLAAERGESMSIVQALRKTLGLAESASEAEVVSAVEARTALGAAASAITGEASPEAARGVLEAWKHNAARTPALAEALHDLQAKKAERDKRQAVKALVREGKLTPGIAWRDGDKAKGFSEWAAMQSMEALEAFANVASPMPFSMAAPTPSSGPVDVSAAAATPDIQKAARRAGLSVERYLESKAQIDAAIAIDRSVR